MTDLEMCACGHPREAHYKPGDARGACTRDAAGVWPSVPCRCPGYERFEVDACQHITRCADGACKYRFAFAARALVDNG